MGKVREGYYQEYYQKNRDRILKRKKNDLWNYKLRHAKIRAKKLNIPFDIDREHLDSIWVEFCPILKIKLSYTENTKICDNSATLDRVIPELGYVKGNVQILSHKANRMKSNATLQELKKFAEYILSLPDIEQA